MQTFLIWNLLLGPAPPVWLDDWEVARVLGRLHGKPIFAVVH